jgi:hypothetical protein
MLSDTAGHRQLHWTKASMKTRVIRVESLAGSSENRQAPTSAVTGGGATMSVARIAAVPATLMFLLLAVATMTAFAQTRPLVGGVQQNAPPPLQGGATQDEFNSRGGDDKRPYVTDDGRWFDRCNYERDHPGPYDQLYGKPATVPVDTITSIESRRIYVRCAVNACDPSQRTAVCWRNPNPDPPQGQNGTSYYPTVPGGKTVNGSTEKSSGPSDPPGVPRPKPPTPPTPVPAPYDPGGGEASVRRQKFNEGFAKGVASCLTEIGTNPFTIGTVVASVAAQRYVAFLGTAVAAKRYADAAAGVGLAARALALKSAMDAPNDAPKSIDPRDVGEWQGKRFCVWMGVGASFLPTNVCPANEPPPVPRSFGPGGLTLGKVTPKLKPSLLDDPNDLSFLKGINSARGNTPRNNANCAPCAASVDAALDGRPVGPAIPLNDGTPICQIESFYGRVFGPPTTIETIDTALKNLGPGARAIIVGYRADGSSHVFNGVNRRDIVQFLDGQIEGFADLGKRQGYRGFRAMRTDN